MKTKLFSIAALLPFLALAQYSNGGLSTGPTTQSGVAAPAGYTWSEAQSNTGNTTESNNIGGVTGAVFGVSNFFLADDFIIPAGQSWQISSIEVFAYQTGYIGSTSPFNVLRLNILNGDPSLTTSTSVFGDDTTNRFASGTDAMMYRIFNTTVPPPGTAPTSTRKIWRLAGTASVTLSAGIHWLKFQYQSAVTTNGGFTPTVTIPGSRGLPAFNAMQLNASTGVWTPLVDEGNPVSAPDFTIDLPFIINYTVLGTDENLQFDNRVAVYPNPVVDVFKVNLPPESRKSSTILELYDASGRLIKKLPYGDTYNVEGLEKGVYLLKVDDGTNKKVMKLVKK